MVGTQGICQARIYGGSAGSARSSPLLPTQNLKKKINHNNNKTKTKQTKRKQKEKKLAICLFVFDRAGRRLKCRSSNWTSKKL